jgi:pSer/pThr/pTyr-binding forkhead associated (FHA) protein
MAAPKTEVLVTVGGSERSRYLFMPGDYVIGRNLDCAVCVEAGQVSRQHAKLILDYDNAFIEDLGSSNGTRVNGKPVHARTRLRPNQKVQCGAATIELRRLRREASELSLSPATAFVGQARPPEMLREKKYDIGNIVAVGGMGEVLDAKEAALERRVAMKTRLGPASKDELQRFINEARITGQLELPRACPNEG